MAAGSALSNACGHFVWLVVRKELSILRDVMCHFQSLAIFFSDTSLIYFKQKVAEGK